MVASTPRAIGINQDHQELQLPIITSRCSIDYLHMIILKSFLLVFTKFRQYEYVWFYLCRC